MPFRRLVTHKPFVTLGLVVAVWLILPVMLKTFARASFYELVAPIDIAAERVRAVQDVWSLRGQSKDELIEAGRDLARLNASYELAVSRNTELQSEIKRLESLLRLPSFAAYRYEHARVARRDFSGWWRRLVIRKGQNYGIPLDAPVIFTGGVVGRVTEVHATTAVVELISSPQVRLAGAVEGDDPPRPFSYQGGINPTLGPSKGIVEYVPLDISVAPTGTKRLVTAGFGGVFPPGLTIGTITHLEPSSDGLFKSGEVKLDERLGSLTEVTVLVPLNPE